MRCADRSGDTFAEFLASLSRHMHDHQLRDGGLAVSVAISIAELVSFLV